MKILGIDPGTARCGWAIVEEQHGTVTPCAYGCITTPSTMKQHLRLHYIYTHLDAEIHVHKPDTASIEQLFFTTNAKTVIPVAEARGVVLLLAAVHHIDIVSYSPPAVKRAICGVGNAPKQQVQSMVKRLLKLKEVPKPDDTADALAVALTHAFSYRMNAHS